MGGSQLDVLYAARHERREYDVQILMGSEGPLADACRAEKIPFHVIPIQNSLLAPVPDLRALSELTRHFRLVQPDIVCTHASKAGILGRAAALLAGVPTVMHTLVTPPYHDGQRPSVRWSIVRLERMWSRFTDQYISVSRMLADDFVQNGICRADRIIVVPSGIDFEAFPALTREGIRKVREHLGIARGWCVVISVGELSPGKGHDLTLEVAARTVHRFPELAFVIVGSGTQRANLESRIVERNLGGRVILAGHRGDVGALLAASDIFIQSSWKEGLSRALVEAMYSGIPPVATDVGGTSEVVVEGETGFLVPPGDVDALASRLESLLDDAGLRESIGRRARESVQAERSIEAMNGALTDAYHRLLSSGHERGRLEHSAGTHEQAQSRAV
jgi:glycosyltransferase involved in cell wall biosynthesis